MAEELRQFCEGYGSLFWCFNRDQTDHAWQYVCGLFAADESNLSRMGQAVSECTYEDLQHFLSGSPWDARAVTAKVSQDAHALLGGFDDTALLIDESAFEKKGTRSVGVARQYNGRLGKIDSCQVGVFAAVARGRWVIPTDMRLYLPESWCANPERCAAAGIPEGERTYRTKIDLALELVERQLALGGRFAWVGADSLYGRSFQFCVRLEELGQTFCVDIPSDHQLCFGLPRASGGTANPQEVAAYAAGLPARAWRWVQVRDGTKGPIRVQAHHRLVWWYDADSEMTRRWHLLLRRDKPGAEIRYSLSNARTAVGLQPLTGMAAQRYWIERAFEDAKRELGMAEYQVRGWVAWHHHMALVLMASLFMTRFRLTHEDEKPLLSAADVRQLLEHFLPRRKWDTAQLLREIELRHQRREADTRNAIRRRRGRRRGAKKVALILPK